MWKYIIYLQTGMHLNLFFAVLWVILSIIDVSYRSCMTSYDFKSWITCSKHSILYTVTNHQWWWLMLMSDHFLFLWGQLNCLRNFYSIEKSSITIPSKELKGFIKNFRKFNCYSIYTRQKKYFFSPKESNGNSMMNVYISTEKGSLLCSLWCEMWMLLWLRPSLW